MDNPAARNQLIDKLWSGDYTSAAGRFTEANPELVSLFQAQVPDDASGPTQFHELQSTRPRFEGVLTLLFRARSQKIVPLEVAAMSVLFTHYRVPHVAWDAMVYFTRAVMSRTWTRSFIEDAVPRDPGPSYPVAGGMTAAVFDNFQMDIGHGSYQTTDKRGYTLRMTNWASAFIPALAVPANFCIDTMLGAGGIFRVDRTLSSFMDLFSPVAPDLLAAKRSRWSKYLDAAAAGNIWDKEPYDSPYPPTFFHYHPPIFGRLQSSYDDVNFEMDLMRRSLYHRYACCIQLGGDGLSFMRIIHRLSQNPTLFLMTKPIIIPRLGEAPHGKFHVMHGDWRIWAPLIMKMAEVVNNKQVRWDPEVSDFNHCEHFLRILTTAFSEYVVDISKTGTDYHDSVRFFKAAEKNLSFAYICFFLYIFAFKYLEMRTAVRRNDSKKLDMIWRENLASTRTSLGNKTNYRQMTIVLVYWGYALVEPLQTAFHNTRTVRWIHTHVGWDMPIEILNSWIRAAVVSNVTEELVTKFIAALNFTHVVLRGIQAMTQAKRTARKEHLKDIRGDVDLIKKFLRNNIGTNFATATAPCEDNVLNIDRATWGGNQYPRRNTPWAQMERTMHGYRKYVRNEVTKLCPWHKWL